MTYDNLDSTTTTLPGTALFTHLDRQITVLPTLCTEALHKLPSTLIYTLLFLHLSPVLEPRPVERLAPQLWTLKVAVPRLQRASGGGEGSDERKMRC